MPSDAFDSTSKARVADVEREDEICKQEQEKHSHESRVNTHGPILKSLKRLLNVASPAADRKAAAATVYANRISDISYNNCGTYFSVFEPANRKENNQNILSSYQTALAG